MGRLARAGLACPLGAKRSGDATKRLGAGGTGPKRRAGLWSFYILYAAPAGVESRPVIENRTRVNPAFLPVGN
jgi:hypothetical protein